MGIHCVLDAREANMKSFMWIALALTIVACAAELNTGSNNAWYEEDADVPTQFLEVPDDSRNFDLVGPTDNFEATEAGAHHNWKHFLRHHHKRMKKVSNKVKAKVAKLGKKVIKMRKKFAKKFLKL